MDGKDCGKGARAGAAEKKRRQTAKKRPAPVENRPAKAEKLRLRAFFRLTKWPGAIIFNQ